MLLKFGVLPSVLKFFLGLDLRVCCSATSDSSSSLDTSTAGLGGDVVLGVVLGVPLNTG